MATATLIFAGEELQVSIFAESGLYYFDIGKYVYEFKTVKECGRISLHRTHAPRKAIGSPEKWRLQQFSRKGAGERVTSLGFVKSFASLESR
jgi:hypothetical protein